MSIFTHKSNNLVLLRHGVSYANAGVSVHCEQQNILTGGGVEDALDNARAYRQSANRIEFDKAFSSPFNRAIQTGLNFLSLNDNKPIVFNIENTLHERSYGFSSHVPMSDLISQFGMAKVQSWESEVDTRPSSTGESQEDVYERVVHVFKTTILPRVEAGEKVLVVSHYFVMKALHAHLMNQGPKGMPLWQPVNATPYGYNLSKNTVESWSKI